MITRIRSKTGNTLRFRRWRWLAALILAAFVAIGAAELTLRCLHYDEFPVYDTDAGIGYIPRPNQSGCFKGRYSWALNERSMLNGPWVPDHERGILAISDSLVWGEVQMAAQDKLGACLQTAMGDRYHVWSVGAGSWANLNEVEYLNRHDDVVRNIHALVWIANAGDFDTRSEWSSDFTHPRRRPFLLGYLVGKASVPWMNRLFSGLIRQQEGETGSNAEVSAETARELRDWLKRAPRDLIRNSLFVWYPDAAEFKTRDAATSHLVSEVRNIVEAGGLRFFDLRSEPGWRSDYYRDEIHPNPEGDRVFASIIKVQLSSAEKTQSTVGPPPFRQAQGPELVEGLVGGPFPQ